MSMKYLGETFDIHGGGLDNQFPHHECEIAQSEAATGKSFAKYWIHNNLVTVNGQKMSKSLGNFVTLKDAFRKFHPLVIRFFILQSHYRSTLDFSDEAVRGAQAGQEKLMNMMRQLDAELARTGEGSGSGTPAMDLAAARKRFLDAMDDDFNTPKAIAVLFDLSRDLNSALHADRKPSKAFLREARDLLGELAGTILGVIPESSAPLPATDGTLEAGLIQLLLEIRDEIRKQKLWELSDRIRDGLTKIGIAIEDKKDGTTWRKV